MFFLRTPKLYHVLLGRVDLRVRKRDASGDNLTPYTQVKDRQKDDGNKCWSFQSSVVENKAATQNVSGYVGATVFPLVSLGVSI
jgi:hypothetical protein